MSPLISVIIPLYNKQRFVERTLTSVLRQTYTNLEIIVIDDGSKDNSFAIAQKVVGNDNRVKLISRENRGVSYTRNQGLELASGELISFIDADDYISPDFYTALYTAMRDYDADISVIKYFRVSEKGEYKFKSSFNAQDYKVELFDKATAIEQFFSGVKFNVGACNKLFKRAVLYGDNPVRYPLDIYYGEDVPFAYNAVKNARKVVYLPFKAYAYVRAKNSQVTSRLTPKKLTMLNGMDYCVSTFPKQEYPASSYSYVAGWRVLVNFEIFFYMFRDGYFDYEIYCKMRSMLKNDMKHLTKSKKFPLYRRLLLPFASFLLNALYRIKFAKSIRKSQCENEK